MTKNTIINYQTQVTAAYGRLPFGNARFAFAKTRLGPGNLSGYCVLEISCPERSRRGNSFTK